MSLVTVTETFSGGAPGDPITTENTVFTEILGGGDGIFVAAGRTGQGAAASGSEGPQLLHEFLGPTPHFTSLEQIWLTAGYDAWMSFPDFEALMIGNLGSEAAVLDHFNSSAEDYRRPQTIVETSVWFLYTPGDYGSGSFARAETPHDVRAGGLSVQVRLRFNQSYADPVQLSFYQMPGEYLDTDFYVSGGVWYRSHFACVGNDLVFTLSGESGTTLYTQTWTLETEAAISKTAMWAGGGFHGLGLTLDDVSWTYLAEEGGDPEPEETGTLTLTPDGSWELVRTPNGEPVQTVAQRGLADQ